MLKNRIAIGLVLVIVATGTTGCASQRMMQRGARDGADQLVALQAELQQKIRAEQNYYRSSIEDLTNDVREARKDDYEIFLAEQVATKFVTPAQDGVTSEELKNFLDGFVAGWAEVEKQRQARIGALHDKLDASQASLQLSNAKINDLLNKLRTLGEAPSKKALAGFVVDFVDTTYRELQAARQESP